jgi:hypothetical protein
VVQREGVFERDLRFGDCRVRLRFAGGGLAGALLPALAQRRDDAGGGGAVHATIALWEEPFRAHRAEPPLRCVDTRLRGAHPGGRCAPRET